MLYSMTGYGKDECQYNNKKISVEVKSLNSKQLDLSTRIPTYYREKELIIRNMINSQLLRGKIDFTITVDSIGAENIAQVNHEAIAEYYNQLKELAANLDIHEESNWMSLLVRLPEVLKSEKTELEEEEWEMVQTCVDNAIDNLLGFREQEGMALEKDITKRVYTINNLVSEIEVFEDDRIKTIRNRILTNLKDIGDEVDYDENRLEQELVYYIEKLDINEEKVRLINHCKYFIDTIDSGDAVGKKLGFIVQEIGREINTLGSKANNADIQRIVVQMKDELEKIKEQLMNVL